MKVQVHSAASRLPSQHHARPNLEPGGCTSRATQSFQQTHTHTHAVGTRVIAIARQLQETLNSAKREVAGDAAGFHQDEMFLILQEQLLSFSDLCFSHLTQDFALCLQLFHCKQLVFVFFN